ncbi:MAG TPA: hypothetical protein VNR42_01275 [Solirubrobacteraceae bacterium]|nr:hypothetical protein [Solirubrobacteraceae bacterium]
MDQMNTQLVVTLDVESAEKLSGLAARANVDVETIAGSLLSSALDEIEPDARTVTALLDGIPGAFESAQLGLKQAAEGKVVPLDAL